MPIEKQKIVYPHLGIIDEVEIELLDGEQAEEPHERGESDVEVNESKNILRGEKNENVHRKHEG